jgi:hypothetical protein
VMMRCENRVPRVATKTRLRLCPRGGARTPSVAERTWLLPCEATNAVGAFQQQSDARAREVVLSPVLDVAGYLLNDTGRHRRHRRRCLTLRGEGTRRLTTIREISPLAQSFLSAVRLQCSGLTRYLSNTHTLSLCKIRIPSVWVSPRTIADARFHVHFNHRTALRVWRSIGCNLARTIQDV